MEKILQAAFVNSTESPLEIKGWHGFFVKEEEDTLSLSGCRDYIYPHPDAPNDARILVNTSEFICSAKKGEWKYSMLFMMLQSQTMILEMLKKTR